MATRENAHRGLSYKEKLMGRNLKDLGEEHDELVVENQAYVASCLCMFLSIFRILFFLS